LVAKIVAFLQLRNSARSSVPASRLVLTNSGYDAIHRARAQSGLYADVETLTMADFSLRDLSRKGLELLFFGGGGTCIAVSSHAIRA
jgi:hypothetical protein